MPGSQGDFKEDRPFTSTGTEQTLSSSRPNSALIADGFMTDGFMVPNLDPYYETPPAYGDEFDHLQFSQPGFEAGAAVTDSGRINININAKNRRLADLLAPAIQNQLRPESPSPPPAYTPPSLGGQPGQSPPPHLNVVVQIVGSRGDVQPFVALGRVLKDTYGHRVRIATHPVFQSFVEENGLEFFSIGGDPAELMAFMVKHPGLTPGFEAIKSGEITRRRKGIADILLGCWRSCIEAGDGLGPPPPPHRGRQLDISHDLPDDLNGKVPFVADAIIANPPSFAHIHVAEKLGIPLHMMFTMPWTPTRAFPHPLADIQSSNTDDVMTKYLSYILVEMMTWQGLGDVINRFRTSALDLQPLSVIWAPGLLNRLKIPYTYCWSPALISKPACWGKNIDISGFYFLDLATSYTPEPDLAAFLEAGPPPVYIGFGSIVVDNPNVLTRMIFDAVRYTGVRALVSKGWGGLGGDDLTIPEGIFMLGNVPHDWLFEHVSCVVHHGGAGTTAAGIKAGKPTLVVPFFGDQPFWGDMIARAKAGPDPIRYKKLTAEKLAEAIRFCLKEETVQQARVYGEKIREEKGTDVGSQCFHNHLDFDALRCSIAPSHTAVWRVRRSKVRLSPLAAATLVGEGFLDYSDLKLYRPRHYNTEDQPTDPISAATASLVGDITTIGMAITDMPREMFKSRTKGTDSPETPGTPKETADERKSSKSTRSGSAAADDSRLDVDESPLSPLNQSNASHVSLADFSSNATSSTATTQSRPRGYSRTESASRAMKDAFSRRDSSPAKISMNAAVGAGKSVGRIVSTGMKTHMNLCLGLAKGFRNLPTLYNDDTVRPLEQVTDITSGIKVATKEFGYGMYDGLAGLVTQPMKGAEKEGVAGFFKGVGKGIGGIVAKPAAGFWAIPAYTMQGVHAQINKAFAKSSQNYIITSRIIQGQRALRNSGQEERMDIIGRWKSGMHDLNSFKSMKRREKYKLGSRKNSRQQGLTSSAGASSSSLALRPDAADDEDFEQAIYASVAETSRGNAEEDARIEAAIRQSVKAVRSEREPREDFSRVGMGVIQGDLITSSIFEDDDYKMTDEEYQNVIEQAVQHSLRVYGNDAPLPHEYGIAELDSMEIKRLSSQHPPIARKPVDNSEVDLERALEQSRSDPTAAEEDEFERAITASKEDAERQRTERTEEDIVLEYIKKQSLAEEELRRKRDKGKGKLVNDDEEELKRAMEESLNMSRSNDSGPF